MNARSFGTFGLNYANIGCVPEKRIAFERRGNKQGINFDNLPWDKKHLEELIQKGKVIVGKADVIDRQQGATADYSSRKVYQFTLEAEKEWRDVLNEFIKAFDFSEAD